MFNNKIHIQNGIFKSPYDDINIPDITLSRLVLNICDKRSDQIALINSENDEYLTYSMIANNSRKIASGLTDIDVKKVIL